MIFTLTFISTILSIFSAVIASLVIFPYLVTKFYYKPDLWIFAHSFGHSPPIFTRSGGKLEIAIHAKNKERVVVESVWFSQSTTSEKSSTSTKWASGLPSLLTGDIIPPRTKGAPYGLIAKSQVIGDSDRLQGYAEIVCKGIDNEISKMTVSIVIKAHIHQGDLPPFLNMHTPPTIECIFPQPIQIQEMKE